MSYFNGEMPENVRTSGDALGKFADLDIIPTDKILEPLGLAKAEDDGE